jgi:predicted ATP-grasp superfamily ATP-dependent carboligase
LPHARPQGFPHRFPDCFPHSFLVVAHSARLLAQSAARGGHRVCALDLFNDADTRRFAVASEAVHSRAGGDPGFDRADLLWRAGRLCPPSRCLGFVYGAGFEDDVESLKQLATGRELLGNPPELVEHLKDPVHFFGLLDRLSIPHPPTTLARPRALRGWLYKRRGGSGGAHVIDASAAISEAAGAGQGYYQRRTPGRSLSLLFLADGRHAQVVGISHQLTRRVDNRRYTYAGAVGPIDLPATVSASLLEALQALVAHTGLVGCNSIDFLLDGDRPSVLEINPRPSATIDLYDDDWPRALFDAHLRACRGKLPRKPARRATPVRAHAIVYADAPLTIGPEASFPAWCTDTPHAGSQVAAGEPICTVRADGADVPSAMRQLQRRRRLTELRLTKRSESEDTYEGNLSAPEREPLRGPVSRVAVGTPR